MVARGEERVTLTKGERRPITREGLKTGFRRILPTAQIENFRFHDNRHTAATRVLRAGGNLKTVQKLLRHENITTTTKYAHVSDEDVMAAMQAAAERAEAAKAQVPAPAPDPQDVARRTGGRGDHRRGPQAGTRSRKPVTSARRPSSRMAKSVPSTTPSPPSGASAQEKRRRSP